MSDVGISLPETLRGGRYVLGRMLGQGGMAVVVVAQDTALGVERAVKLLLPHGSQRQSLRRRLKAEARAMARLNHPNILAIHDVGLEGDLDWVVMDLATGGSLNDLQEHGPMDPWVATSFMIQVLSALGAAHAQGIVHRDVKPHNVLLDQNGRALLADFGIALLATEDRRTRTGVAMGSIAYMPPEQRLDAARVGPAADLYAVGSTLFNLITGSNPVDLFLALEGSARWSNVPEALRPILRRATQMDADERFPDATTFAHALMEVLKSNGTDLPSIHGMSMTVGGTTQGSQVPRDVRSHAPTAAAMDYLDNRVPTVGVVDLPPIDLQPLEPVVAPVVTPVVAPTQFPAPVTTLSADTTELAPTRPILPFLLIGVGALGLLAVVLVMRPLETLPETPRADVEGVAATPPVPAPPVALEPVLEPVPDVVSAPVQPPVAPQPRPTAVAPVPTPPEPAPDPADPTESPVSGTWLGSLGGTFVEFQLSGGAGRVRGQSTSTFGERVETSGVVGTFDPAGNTLRLSDTSDAQTHYTLVLDGERMQGQIETARGTKRLALRRRAP